MNPAKFDTLCKNLDVILDLVIRSLIPEEDKEGNMNDQS